jgi:glutamyl/glutaminyl-tRNA synthetase
MLKYDPKLLIWKKASYADTVSRLQALLDHLKGIPADSFERKFLENNIKEFITEKNLDTGEILWPLRVGLSGLKGSPGPFELAEVLGKERVLARIEQAISQLKNKN